MCSRFIKYKELSFLVRSKDQEGLISILLHIPRCTPKKICHLEIQHFLNRETVASLLQVIKFGEI